MIEENWIDCVCYSIYFKNSTGRSFYRYIGLPLSFPEANIDTFFQDHFKGQDITIIDIKEMNDMWVSKHEYSPFMENISVCDELKIG